jgi:RNA polymerase sigma-70 factor (ECF subfamily)
LLLVRLRRIGLLLAVAAFASPDLRKTRENPMIDPSPADRDNSDVERLVRLARAGDREAFGRLFERFERTVFAIAVRRLRQVEEAEELVQDVFVQALSKLSQLRDGKCFGAWLRSITHRMAINRLVRRHRGFATEQDALMACCVESTTPLSAALATERSTQVHEGLARLREMDRQTLVAFYVKGQSLVEMSDEFDAPLGTIKRRLHVARKRLAKEVEPMAV